MASLSNARPPARALIAFRSTSSVHSKPTRRRRAVQVGKLALEVGQLGDFPAILMLSVTNTSGQRKIKLDCGYVYTVLLSVHGSMCPATGEVLRCDVIVDRVHSLNVTTTTRELLLDDSPEMMEVVAHNDQGRHQPSPQAPLLIRALN